MKSLKCRKTILSAVVAAVLAAGVLAAGVRQFHQRHYEYIDLPIVLSNEEAVVDVIRDGLTERNPKITITFTAKGQYSDQIETLTARLVEKALEPTDSPEQGDYIRFQYGGYQVRYSNPQNESGSYDYTIKILPHYYTNETKENAVDEEIEEILPELGFSRGTSDYDKIKAIHDYIVDHCAYDWRNSLLTHRHMKSTAYGALVNGEATCQGYSVAMYRLLREAGIDCRIITGDATSPATGESEYHAWNLVCLDGSWYNVDVSWDDETEGYDYFLKSDVTFAASHVRESEYADASFRAAYPVSGTDW